ncbi:hypothetical protein PsYK624_171170 [Phanerochaete sordida]|uniref:Uncharacterized protein n=1 Tax=Phanerochaete sordida TaxID=48140 RepID=A0A9P3GYY0_9APHY|nr:hypothetical protein PsYK624_171170 [Phanerochaete sordida]
MRTRQAARAAPPACVASLLLWCAPAESLCQPVPSLTEGTDSTSPQRETSSPGRASRPSSSAALLVCTRARPREGSARARPACSPAMTTPGAHARSRPTSLAGSRKIDFARPTSATTAQSLFPPPHASCSSYTILPTTPTAAP